MPKALDYDASVPIDTGAPFRVSVDPSKPPGDVKYKDFVAKDVPQATKPTAPKRDDYKRSPQALYPDDYVSPVAAKVVRTSEKDRIKAIAKEMWDEESSKRKLYEEATKLIEETKAKNPKAFAEPSKELTRAMKIAERKPKTKEEVLQAAAKQFYDLK